MVKVSVAQKVEEVKAFVLSINPEITFVKKVGIGLFFETPDDDKYAVEIKALMKKQPGFGVLYFAVEKA